VIKKYVLGFMFAGEHVGLVRKSKPDWQKGKWNGVGGKIETVQGFMDECDEHPLDAMVREFREETGLETSREDWSLRGMMESPTARIYVFMARRQGTASMTWEGDEPVAWWQLGYLPENCIHNIKALIELCLDVAHPNSFVINYR
jgi:8-oxo-dGTP diphosphatase